METEGIWLSLILSTVVRIVRLVGNSCHAHFSSTSGLLLFTVQRVLALCYFWDLENFALAKNRISKIFILCTQ